MAEVEVEVVGIRIELPANQPILILKALDRPRYLPIWIGSQEAAAITMAKRMLVAPRPLTHQLVIDALGLYGARITGVAVTGREDQTFLAEIRMDDGHTLSARPSDAALLALTADASVFVDEAVLADDGIDAPEPDEDAVAQFREFLDHVSAEDFESEDADESEAGGEADGEADEGAEDDEHPHGDTDGDDAR
ncbi:bifunctional nuclease family protein [Brevibacterium album]|uniref:bifunctional nuclease family protein n=1 Tax=Brevibacterium album TaxID=417948 RepID=UPI0003F56621|nr:bifunctional nuclease family protein [Brevibacterium album]